MLSCDVLCCAMLACVVLRHQSHCDVELCCAVLCCARLCCAQLCWAELAWPELCCAVLRHPSFGFKSVVLPPMSGETDLNVFRQEFFRYIIGARLLDHFTWWAWFGLAHLIALHRWPCTQNSDDRMGQWDIDNVLKVLEETSTSEHFQVFATKAIKRGSMSFEAYNKLIVSKCF